MTERINILYTAKANNVDVSLEKREYAVRVNTVPIFVLPAAYVHVSSYEPDYNSCHQVAN